MTKDVENFIRYVCKLIKDLGDDKEVMKAVLNSIHYDTTFWTIEDTDNFELDERNYCLLYEMGAWNDDDGEGLLTYEEAEILFEKGQENNSWFDDDDEDEDEDEEESDDEDEDVDDDYFISNFENYDYLYVTYDPCDNYSYRFSGDITWVFSLNNFATLYGRCTMEELEQIKSEIHVDHD